MRFLILVKATARSERGIGELTEAMVEAMTDYHEELAKAGALLDTAGLRPSAEGWRVRYSERGRTVLDGPFAETKELVAGYTLIQVRSREEALEWSRRFPNPSLDGGEAEIEVRPLYEYEDFPPSEGIRRFRALGTL